MNKDTMSTVIGLILSVATGVGDYFAHAGPDGLDYSQPTFWIGLVIAALVAVKGYYMHKDPKPAVAPPVNG